MVIVVGFVVDDAIVMPENVYRHIEGGMDRFAAALRGSADIRFTIVSISISLVALAARRAQDRAVARPGAADEDMT